MRTYHYNQQMKAFRIATYELVEFAVTITREPRVLESRLSEFAEMEVQLIQEIQETLTHDSLDPPDTETLSDLLAAIEDHSTTVVDILSVADRLEIEAMPV